MKRPTNITLILGLAIVALIAHAAILYTLNGYDITFYSPRLALTENNTQVTAEYERDLIEKRKQEERTLQIAEAFHALSQEDRSDTVAQEEKKDLLLAMELEAIAYEEPAKNEALALLLADAHEASLLAILEGEPSPALPDAVQLLLESEPTFVQEATQATEGMQGNISDDAIMLYSYHSTMQVGSPLSSTTFGNSLDSHSGIVDEPADTPTRDTPSGLVATVEALSTEQLALQSGDNRLAAEQHKSHDTLYHDKGEGTIAGNDDFIVAVDYVKNPKGKGYLFRMTLTTKPDVHFRRITQNIFFLIDRSHSIPRERFAQAKQAVSEILPLLSSDDTFNILVFDKSVVRFATTNVHNTPDNIAAARAFLEQQKYGGFFATTDLYSSLGGIVPKAVADNEVNLAILLSDGDTYLKPSKQRTMIKRWTTENQGKVSLLCVASGTGNNIPMLDLISSFNKGSIHIARSDAYLPTLMTDLMFAIRNPIGKEMALTSAPVTDANAIRLLPTNARLPNLYEHIPYIIYGQIDYLSDFYLSLQGRYYDKWVNIKRLITFDNALPITDNTIEKMWALQQAYESYDRFLADGNPAHLQHAKQLLDPYKIPTPFR